MAQEKVELLAPAKNFMSIKASGRYADAVYFGIKSYNMRDRADNFDISDMKKISERCHNPKDSSFRVRKCYLTTNIVIYENELNDLRKIIQAAKDADIDAVIVHDVAAMEIAREIGIPFHVSTQCNVSNSMAAKFYENIGAERIIMARECSLRQIKRISSELKQADVEAFVHGAMCSSISGRCYLSPVITGSMDDSANRGRCLQPCRNDWRITLTLDDKSKGLQNRKEEEFMYIPEQSYKQSKDPKKGPKHTYAKIMNSRDMCMIEYIPQLIDAGIKSFKIEGRMREPYYVEVVTRTYRKAIDAHYNRKFRELKAQKKLLTELKTIYNRGFTTGFYFGTARLDDSQLNTGANLSHWRNIEMGKFIDYVKSSCLATIELTNGTLKKGDRLLIMSTKGTFDTYFHQTIDSIMMDENPIDKTRCAKKDNPVTVKIRVDEHVNSGKVDSLYKFTKETFKKGNYQLN